MQTTTDNTPLIDKGTPLSIGGGGKSSFLL